MSLEYAPKNVRTAVRKPSIPLNLKYLVPKGGLEPPHPCEYMDLNHARLPIPPLRQTRMVQVHVLARVWGLSSPFGTRYFRFNGMAGFLTPS